MVKWLVEFTKTACWFGSTLGAFAAYHYYNWYAAGFVCIMCFLGVWQCVQWLLKDDYQNRLDEYANYRMPIFVVQDPERHIQVSQEVEKIKEILRLSGNQYLDPDKDVHDIYFQDPRAETDTAVIESTAQYVQRVEATKERIIKEFKHRQFKTNSFDEYKRHYLNQDLTPPDPIDRRFGVWSWN